MEEWRRKTQERIRNTSQALRDLSCSGQSSVEMTDERQSGALGEEDPQPSHSTETQELREARELVEHLERQLRDNEEHRQHLAEALTERDQQLGELEETCRDLREEFKVCSECYRTSEGY